MFSTFLFFSFFFITTTHSSAIIHRISSPNQLHKNHTRFPVVVSISLPSPPRNDIHTHSFSLLQIWHGLSDSYENPALGSLAKQINLRYPGTPVYMIRLDQSGSQDRRATWFGSANEQIEYVFKLPNSVCEQLIEIEQLSLGFDAIGFSQGGQLMRAYVERCNRPKVRNLITLGSQHLGVSGSPPCNSVFDLGCHILHKLIESGTVYGPYAQHKIIPAQYFRDQSNLEPYMKHNEFLRDINNERWNDSQPRPSTSLGTKHTSRTLNRSRILSCSEPTRWSYLLPRPTSHFPMSPRRPCQTSLIRFPLHFKTCRFIRKRDYIGLKTLDQAGKIHYGTCFGGHMQIDEDCWQSVMDWLGDGPSESLYSALQADAQQLVLQHHPSRHEGLSGTPSRKARLGPTGAARAFPYAKAPSSHTPRSGILSTSMICDVRKRAPRYQQKKKGFSQEVCESLDKVR
ncbi:uncharacterized protein VP01_225g6 [Puccinia sorghi]|uniref:Palmitoyl-protein thioesterase 1 n=1 Tax=Puccinia sorghi TaxID=27349 RepID=A0A0L6V8C8_9BASI|nr:uncharacterized protein VP01_225g6 [Puccinia sorghi]